MGAHQEANVLDPQAGLIEGQLELAHPARLVEACVHQHHAAARGYGERVHVRHPRPGQRQAKAPQAGKHAVRPGQLPPPPRFGHAVTCRGIGAASSQRRHARHTRPTSRQPRRAPALRGPAVGRAAGRPRPRPGRRHLPRAPRPRGRGDAQEAVGSTSTPGIEDPGGVQCGLRRSQRGRERVGALAVVPGPVVPPDGVVVGDRAARRPGSPRTPPTSPPPTGRARRRGARGRAP